MIFLVIAIALINGWWFFLLRPWINRMNRCQRGSAAWLKVNAPKHRFLIALKYYFGDNFGWTISVLCAVVLFLVKVCRIFWIFAKLVIAKIGQRISAIKSSLSMARLEKSIARQEKKKARAELKKARESLIPKSRRIKRDGKKFVPIHPEKPEPVQEKIPARNVSVYCPADEETAVQITGDDIAKGIDEFFADSAPDAVVPIEQHSEDSVHAKSTDVITEFFNSSLPNNSEVVEIKPTDIAKLSVVVASDDSKTTTAANPPAAEDQYPVVPIIPAEGNVHEAVDDLTIPKPIAKVTEEKMKWMTNLLKEFPGVAGLKQKLGEMLVKEPAALDYLISVIKLDAAQNEKDAADLVKEAIEQENANVVSEILLVDEKRRLRDIRLGRILETREMYDRAKTGRIMSAELLTPKNLRTNSQGGQANGLPVKSEEIEA